MKMRLLTDVDLARTAPHPIEKQRLMLAGILKNIDNARFGYGPGRDLIPDIINLKPALGFDLPRPPLDVLVALLEKRCRSAREFEMNAPVLRGLYDYSENHEVGGVRADFMPFKATIGNDLRFSNRMVLDLNGRYAIPFFEPRRSNGLSAVGRRFAFSVMHEHIRKGYPDYAPFDLVIVQFEAKGKSLRKPVFWFDEGMELYSLGELEQMVATTYGIWMELQEARTAEIRAAHSGY